MTRGVSRGRAIARNAAWLLVGRLAAQALAALFTVLLARRLGPEGFGAYAFVSALVFLANVATTFGTDMVLIRDAASGAERHRWESALAVQLVLSLAAIAAAWLLAPLAGAAVHGTASPLRIYSLSLVPAAAFSVCTAILRGTGRMGAYAALTVATAALQLAALIPLAAGAMSLESVMAALLAVQVGTAALAWPIAARQFAPLRTWRRPTSADALAMFRATGTIGIVGVLGMAYQRAPTVVLGALAGPIATGWFASAARIAEASKVGHVALFGAAYPAMAEAHATAGGGLGNGTPSIERTQRVAMGAAAVLSIALLAASPFAARLLFGAAFAPSAPGLAILALSLVPSAWSTYQSLDLVARHRESLALRAQAASLAALLALLALLVPSIGWIGGCVAVLSAETVQSLALLAVRRAEGLDLGHSAQVGATNSI